MTNQEIEQFISENEWVFAKSMPKTPHEYVIESKAVNLERYFKFIDHILTNGTDKRFFRMTYRYFTVGKYQYWAMFIRNNERIINRSEI